MIKSSSLEKGKKNRKQQLTGVRNILKISCRKKYFLFKLSKSCQILVK